ncbi:thiamine pyrophosphokinase [Exophiala mesophila]|uniref:Thiamine pyrophosphokinase n=1 Tax=Exophiala mesophila TaxID=212818 RepID=A0A0D1Y8X7_EXOME|nr:thiamine pyrophosphokinase [Exophiala mesophila]KIV97111.1 thiamine pyrophosphokinase [Exophiala mesophila]
MSTHWHPSAFFPTSATKPHATPPRPYAVLVLNQSLNSPALHAVLTNAKYLVCADAGADRYLKEHQLWVSSTSSIAPSAATSKLSSSPSPGVTDSNNPQAEHRLPDAIVGDLDSLTAETEAYYRARGVEIVRDPDQYSTDFTKSLRWIRSKVVAAAATSPSPQQDHDHHNVMDVLVLGGLGGRVDQGFSQIHHLYMAENIADLLQGRIYLLSEQSLSFVLADGLNLIHIEPGSFAENVGIIPILGKSFINTKGLEWDVEDWPTQFGGQVSTSNHIRSNVIQVSFQGPKPLFTMELDTSLSASGA